MKKQIVTIQTLLNSNKSPPRGRVSYVKAKKGSVLFFHCSCIFRSICKAMPVNAVSTMRRVEVEDTLVVVVDIYINLRSNKPDTVKIFRVHNMVYEGVGKCGWVSAAVP